MYRPSDTAVTQILPFSTDPALRRRFLLHDEPLKANVRFGLLLEVLDKLAEDTALAYVRRSIPEARVVTAAIDHIRVRCAADISKDVVLLAQVNYVGRTSLEVGVRIEQPGDPPSHIASCYVTMVAQTADGQQVGSTPLPGLVFEDDLERQRESKAIKRRNAYRRSRETAQQQPTRDEYALLARLHTTGAAWFLRIDGWLTNHQRLGKNIPGA